MKRRVDATNQRRNDLAEELDRALLAWLEPRGLAQPEAPLHSESPGLIDRPAVDSGAEDLPHAAKRPSAPDAPQGHAERNLERLAILEEQRADLAGCLDALWRRDPGRSAALQALPPVEDVQRPVAEPGHLPQTLAGTEPRLGFAALAGWPIDVRRGYAYKEGLSSVIP